MSEVTIDKLQAVDGRCADETKSAAVELRLMKYYMIIHWERDGTHRSLPEISDCGGRCRIVDEETQRTECNGVGCRCTRHDDRIE